MPHLDAILGTLGLIGVALFAALLVIGAIRLVGARRRQRAEIEAMPDDDLPELAEPELPPVEAELVANAGGQIDYADAAGRVTAEELAGHPDAPPAHVRRPGPRERLVTVERGPNLFELDLLRVGLIDRGIWAFVADATNALGGTGLASGSLLVAEADLDAARAAINELRSNASR